MSDSVSQEPKYPWTGDISEDENAVRAVFEGKTVQTVAFGEGYGPPVIRLAFTDGSTVELESWDYEGYSSGIYIRPS